MSSSNPNCYGRKRRKDTAEIKFDALFRTNRKNNTYPMDSDTTSSNEDPTKRRKRMNPKYLNDDVILFDWPEKNRISLSKRQNADSAAAKFDAIFGTSESSSSTSNKTSTIVKSRSASNSDDNEQYVEFSRSDSAFLIHSSSDTEEDQAEKPNSNSKSKYDILYEKNEKLASDKFDALFCESEHISAPKRRKPKTYRSLHGASDPAKATDGLRELDDLFSVGAWVENSDIIIKENSHTSPRDSQDSDPGSPSKSFLPGITHASMVKVGGRLVLNIQRGGSSSSLAGEGTILKSPVLSSSVENNLNLKSCASESTISSITESESSSSSVTRNGCDGNQPTAIIKIDSPPTDKCNDHSETEGASTEDRSRKEKDLSSVSHEPAWSRNAKNKSILPVKSKKLLGGSSGKVSIANYNPRPWAKKSEDKPDQNKQRAKTVEPLSQPTKSSYKAIKLGIDSSTEATPQLKRAVTWPEKVGDSIVTSIKCQRNHAEFFTVVQHVKNYQNCLEEGEIQEFKDEVTYLVGGLQKSHPVSVRCLSATNLASKCQQQNFRLYLRAHNVLPEIFSVLQDASEFKTLSLAASALLYMFSRDRQIEIDRNTVNILLKLVDPLDKGCDAKPAQNEEISKRKAKYSSLLKRNDTQNELHELEALTNKIKDLIDRCNDPLVKSSEISTKSLASEALLRFTASRNHDWFREEVRLKGGLDHIIGLVKTEVEILEGVKGDLLIPDAEKRLCKLERLLRVLESSIVNSQRNGMYLVTHQRAVLLKKLSILLSKCTCWLNHIPQPHNETNCEKKTSSFKPNTLNVLRNVISQIIKLLVNISNDSEWSSSRIGDQEKVLANVIYLILHIPGHVNKDHRYELTILSLGLLINLVESSAKNRMILMKLMTQPIDKELYGATNVPEQKPTTDNVLAVEALVQLFVIKEATARQNEILGEDGVKKAAEEKKSMVPGGFLTNNQDGNENDDDAEGYWVETEEGMEWVIPDKKEDEGNMNEIGDLSSSQSSEKSQSQKLLTNPRNIEASLTAEQKTEMKEALEKASDHMENSVVASYVALVLGCLIHGSRSNSSVIMKYLPNDGDLTPMIRMLKKFLSFMSLTNFMSKKGEVKIIRVIEDMEEVQADKCR